LSRGAHLLAAGLGPVAQVGGQAVELVGLGGFRGHRGRELPWRRSGAGPAADGEVGVYVWDYARKMELIRHYWDAAACVDPTAAERGLDERFALCHPESLSAAFSEAGLRSVKLPAIDIDLRFADFDDYWQPFLAGQGPAPAHAMHLQPAQREGVRALLRERLPVRPDGAVVLQARAWVARGMRR
jgi:hypothetical protein